MVFFFEKIITSSATKPSSSCSRKMCLASSSTSSLNSFESEISKYLLQLSLNLSSEILTFPWLQKCLQILPKINKAFAKLVVDIDYPMEHWEAASVDEYLNQNLTSMESLNSITSSISHLRGARLAASHALSRLEVAGFSSSAVQRLKAVEFVNSNKCSRKENLVSESKQVGRCSVKERIIRQAMAVKQQVCYWVLRVVESSIKGNSISCCSEMKEDIRHGPSSVSLSLKACEEIMVRKGVLKEVAQVNEGLILILEAADSGSSEQFEELVLDLQTRLVVLGKLMESFEEDVNKLFSEILHYRNEMLDIFQQNNHF